MAILADQDCFDAGIALIHEHVSEMHKQITTDRVPHGGLLDVSFKTMESTLEELSVAQAVMYAQNEALAEAQITAETWRHYYQDLFETAPDAYLVTDMQGVVQEVNRAGVCLLGVSKRFLKGKPLTTFLPIERRHTFRELLSDTAKAAQPIERAMSLLPHKSRPFQAAITVSTVRDRQGRPLSLRWLIRDVTERHEAEEERCRALVEAVQDYAILLLDEKGEVVNWNPGAERIFGYGAGEARGKPFSLIFTPEDRANGMDQRDLDTAASSGKAEEEHWHLRKDGTRFWGSGVITALRDKSGQLRWYAKVLRDVTAQKQEQERLKALYERERRIAATFQRVLLQEIAEDAVPGLVLACRYEAAWAEAQVGGDFFDMVSLSDGAVALVVGDVFGKGLAAAAHTAEIKYALRLILSETSCPAEALTRLNRYLCDGVRLTEGGETRFVTLGLIVMTPATGEMTVCLAGAEAALLQRTDGAMEEIGVKGGLMGIECGMEYTLMTATLNPGDMILMATDGITEARQGKAFLDYGGLVRLTRSARGCTTLGEMAETILAGARDFAGGSLSDDACLLLARRTSV